MHDTAFDAGLITLDEQMRVVLSKRLKSYLPQASLENNFMASRTQIICVHEGRRGRSIDPIFIQRLLKELKPAWIRPWKGNNIVRTVPLGGRSELVARFPIELQACLRMGGDTTLMVWADLDHDMQDGDQLKEVFWHSAQTAGVNRSDFDKVVVVFAKDRLENWIEFLLVGSTDEAMSGPRQENGTLIVRAAKELACRCSRRESAPTNPPSLAWSCENWRRLVNRMIA